MTASDGARYAKVAVADAIVSIDKPYDYAVPPALRETIAPGCRVLVPFGPGNRRCEGFVLALAPDSGYEKTKPVQALLDDAPVLDGEAIRLAHWMRRRYVCTFYEAARAMLPAGLWHVITETAALVPGVDRDEALACLRQSSGAALLFEALWAAPGGRAALRDLESTVPYPALRAAVKTLVEKGFAVSDTVTRRRVRDNLVQNARLAVSVEEALAFVADGAEKAARQKAVVRLLCEIGAASVREICYFTGVSSGVLTNLAKKGLVELTEYEVYRRPSPSVAEAASAPLSLSEEQTAAFDGLRALCDRNDPACALLFGVTGSGKTSVYIELIRHIRGQGGGAIVMVPEIVLTPQLMEIFSRAFGNRVALLHSGLSLGERYDEWKRVREGRADVVLGTRSAVFAPVKNLRLIVLDEEQEYSYKSENTPRYHARDVAKYRIARQNGLLLLGSATPSVESAYFARAGRYEPLIMRTRFNERALPQVLMADMREELRNGNATSLSALLGAEIEKNLVRGQQSILFLNRRGYNRFLLCEGCGAALNCPRCSVSLAYHSANGRLMCHQCGHSEARPGGCPACHGALRPMGTGTQKVSEELSALFPGTEILRMDADTTSGRGGHEALLDRFKRERIPLLVGTQMVAKGLDIENVTLVGVLDADMALYTGDFRANERAFSLIAQVVGRAGRGAHPGRAVLQTFTPGHPVLKAAAAQDYTVFFEDEIALRQARGLPPFADVMRLSLSGADEDRVRLGCLGLRRMIDESAMGASFLVLGPAPALIVKRNNRYRYHLTLIGRYDSVLSAYVGGLITAFEGDRKNRGVKLSFDLNPY